MAVPGFLGARSAGWRCRLAPPWRRCTDALAWLMHWPWGRRGFAPESRRHRERAAEPRV